MNKITVDKLVELVNESKTGHTRQEKPIVVWFDRVEGDIMKYAEYGDYIGLATALANTDNEIALNLETGSPFTDHKKVIDNGVVRDITEKERFSFIIPSAIKFDDKGKMIPKVYIHSSWTSNMGKNGFTSIEFSKMVHDNLKLPVFLFYPIEWREKIDDDFSGYEEYLCTDNLEDIKKRWFERVSGKNDEGFQIVDNFYLNFLRTAPDELLSSDYTTENEFKLVYPRFQKWEHMSRRMRNELNNLYDVAELDYNKDLFFADGNLDFDRVAEFLDMIPEDKWKECFDDVMFEIKDIKGITPESDRLKTFKVFISIEDGYFAGECSLALLEYYGLNKSETN